MSIRIRAIIVIVLTTLVIILFSVFTSFFLMQSHIESSQETDLLVISDIADHFISAEIKLLKQKTADFAYKLSESEESKWQEVMTNLKTLYPEFIGSAVFNTGTGLVAFAGEFPAHPEVMQDINILSNNIAISSTIPTSSGVQFYLAASLRKDTILILTLPGTYFSDLLSSFVIWGTGHIFMDDAEGHLIANPRPLWVQNRTNFIDMAEIDSFNEETINNFRQALDKEPKIVRYSIAGVPRLCAYRHISESEEGWLLGAVAPLPESPFRDIDRGIVIVGIIGFLLSCIAAIIASDFIKRPFEKMIEEMRRADTAEESNKAKSRFLTTMSHEIRTPMNSIMGFAELAIDKTSEQHTKHHLEKITDNTKWLLRIFNDILDISKIESGKLELENSSFSLEDVFMRCQAVILPDIKEKGLNFNVFMEPFNSKILVGDPVRLYQALVNLLSNAVKFTKAGTVNFSSTIKSSDKDKTVVYFEVKDTGIGMTPEQIDNIFGLFIQVDSGTTRNYGGTGLGLPIAKNIVELMGGKLAVESKLGEGSTFSFEIEFDTEKASANASADAGEERAAASDSKANPYFDALVLICDDNPMNQMVICEHLSRVGINIVTAENGKIGVDMVKERMEKGEPKFDLIFMDILMPVMDGMEAASEIIKLNTETPIVALTANIMANDLENYRKHGMPDCLGKPFTTQELWSVLLKYLKPVNKGA